MENAIDPKMNGRRIEVRAGTLEEVWREQGLGEIAFLKMNIEGAERYALLGLGSLTGENRTDLCGLSRFPV